MWADRPSDGVIDRLPIRPRDQRGGDLARSSEHTHPTHNQISPTVSPVLILEHSLSPPPDVCPPNPPVRAWGACVCWTNVHKRALALAAVLCGRRPAGLVRVRADVAARGDPGFPRDPGHSIFSPEALLPMMCMARALLGLFPPQACDWSTVHRMLMPALCPRLFPFFSLPALSHYLHVGQAPSHHAMGEG